MVQVGHATSLRADQRESTLRLSAAPCVGSSPGAATTTWVGSNPAAARTSRATATATREIRNIVFACDAGMGSSAMGASVLRKKIQDAGHPEVTVVNKAIANLEDSYDLVVAGLTSKQRARVGETQ